MKKLNLDEINTDRAEKSTGGAGNVFRSIETGASRKGQLTEASPQEVLERQRKLKTQGRKGAKAIRINMAFTPENHEYIKVMAKITGQSMTEFCNYMLAEYRREHSEVFDRAKEIIEGL